MEPQSVLRNVYELIKTIALVLILAFVIRTLIVQTFVVQGKSMEPNYFNRDYLLVEKLSYRFSKPQRGEIVVFRNPQNRQVDFVKRIIGLPGEAIEVANGQVKVNGLSLPEPYLGEVIEPNSEVELRLVLGPQQFFMMGDNRNNSLDSRRIGPIDSSDVIGRVFLRVLPLTRFGPVSNPSYGALVELTPQTLDQTAGRTAPRP